METVEYHISDKKDIDFDDMVAVAAHVGRKAEDIMQIMHDAAIGFYVVSAIDAMVPKSKRLLDMIARAEKKLGQPCDVFQAARQHKGRLVSGYWLKVYNDDRSRWVRLEYLGGNHVTAKLKIRRLKR